MTSLTDEAAAARAAGRRIPDFFIVGHAKCGTTALYEMLRRHPQVFMPDYKEPWFFSRDNPNPQLTDERSVAFTGRKEESLQKYLNLFDPAEPGQLLGEASTSYLWSHSAPARIAQVRPDAKLVAVFREPASFLRSLHVQLLQNRHETVTDFRKAVELDGARLQGRDIPPESYWPSALIYSERVRYVEQLKRFREHFPEDQMLILIYDDYRKDNAETVRRVRNFLDVDDTYPIEVQDVNPTIWRRAPRVDAIARTVSRGEGPISGPVRQALKTVTPRRVRHEVLYPLRRRLVWGKPEPVDESFALELKRRYKPEVEALSEYLGRDLVALWRYDQLG